MSNKNRNTVSNDDPLLTVITHGLGGDASNLSLNDRKFSYCEDSIFKYSNYGMDVRIWGATSGIEVTTWLGNENLVSFNPLVTMHVLKLD